MLNLEKTHCCGMKVVKGLNKMPIEKTTGANLLKEVIRLSNTSPPSVPGIITMVYAYDLVTDYPNAYHHWEDEHREACVGNKMLYGFASLVKKYNLGKCSRTLCENPRYKGHVRLIHLTFYPNWPQINKWNQKKTRNKKVSELNWRVGWYA